MGKKASILLMSLVLLTMTASAVLAGGWGMGGSMGSGIDSQMGVYCGMGSPRGNGLGRWGSLELTAEQEEKLLDIRQKLAKETLDLRQQLQRHSLELRRLWAADSPDQAAINKELVAMTPLRIELHNKMKQAQAEMESILTPEQLEKLKSLPPGFSRQGQGLRRGRK